METENPTTIRGIVLAAEWEKNGSISEVDIASYDEKTYRVLNDDMGKQLWACAKKRVTAEGIVVKRKGRLTLQVHRFRMDSANPKKNTD